MNGHEDTFLTPADLDEIRRRAEAATPGPWVIRQFDEGQTVLLAPNDDGRSVGGFRWPLRWARARRGRVYHAVEYNGQPPSGVRRALCGASPSCWAVVTQTDDEPHAVICDACLMAARNTYRRAALGAAPEEPAAHACREPALREAARPFVEVCEALLERSHSLAPIAAIIGVGEAKITPADVTRVRAALGAAPAAHTCRNLESVLAEVAAWGEETFPASTDRAKIAHLRKELDELEAAPHDPEEFADVLMILAHLAHAHGYLDRVAAEVSRKLAICRTRQWGEPDADGVVEHVREGRP